MQNLLKKFFAVTMILTMVMAMSSAAFADTDGWTSFQGNNRNNGVITGEYPVEPEWDSVKLLSLDEATGFSGVDSQPLMTTEGGTTYAYVVTDAKSGPKAFKVDCDGMTIAPGWEEGVTLADVSAAQLGTGAIVEDTWYLPVSYDYQTLSNPYFAYEGGWNINSSKVSYVYHEDYSGLEIVAKASSSNMIDLRNRILENHETIDVDNEDIWANVTVQFGQTADARIKDRRVNLSIKCMEDDKIIELCELETNDLPLGVPTEYSINCTKLLQEAGISGEKTYQLMIRIDCDYAQEGEKIFVRQAGLNKNNMYLKAIENISTSDEPTAKTLVDFHKYNGSISGGRAGQLNTPILCTEGKLYFGSWIRGDASGRNMSKYYEYDIEQGELMPLETGHDDDGFYLAGAAVVEGEKSDYVAFGSTNGYLYLFNAVTGEKVSEVNVGGTIKSSVCYSDGGLYVATQEGCVNKYRLNESRQLVLVWSSNLEETITTTPVVCNGMVYVSCGNMYSGKVGRIVGLDAQTGKLTRFSHTLAGTASGSLLIYDKEGWEPFAYYSTNNGNGTAYCQMVVDEAYSHQIGEAGYALQGFAAVNGYMVYGNDGVAAAEPGKYCVRLYVAK